MQARQTRMTYQRPICLVPVGGGEGFRGMASDLSSGGLFVKGDWQLPVGSEVDVKLETHVRDLPLARARVVWSDAAEKGGVGLQFVEFAHPRTLEVLRTHLGPRRSVESIDTASTEPASADSVTPPAASPHRARTAWTIALGLITAALLSVLATFLR